MTTKNKNEEEHTQIDETNKPTGCPALIFSLFLWWILISHCIMRFKNPSMTETQLFLNLPQSFMLEEPRWGLE